MRYLCLPTPVTYVPRLNTVRTDFRFSFDIPSNRRCARRTLPDPLHPASPGIRTVTGSAGDS
ncbi:hypothetical protein Pres01_56300 [Metapseudomonas resinovorans]|nr:hypothetical protein Pres01_56300 [Pseudomonas resinovorans]